MHSFRAQAPNARFLLHQAIEDFTQAIRIMPTNPDFYHNRGFCYRKQGNFESAIADYSDALRHNPEHYKVHHICCLVVDGLSGSESKNCFRTGETTQALYNRAFSFDKLGRHEDALRDYSRALEVRNSRG